MLIPRPILALLSITLAVACGGASVDATTLGITAAIDPSPPRVGQNTLAITLTDNGGGPVEDVTIDAVPYMPGMGHGSNEAATISEKGNGLYEAHPITFTMAGAWEVTVTVDLTGETAEKVFSFDVPTP